MRAASGRARRGPMPAIVEHQEAVSEITRFQQRFAQEGAWTDRQTLRCNGWTQFAGDAGALFVQNLQAPA